MSTLYNDREWTTQDGTVMAVAEITPSHRQNLLAWMERNAEHLQMVEFLNQPNPNGEQAAFDLEMRYDSMLAMDPVRWVRSTPLYKRLARMNEAETTTTGGRDMTTSKTRTANG